MAKSWSWNGLRYVFLLKHPINIFLGLKDVILENLLDLVSLDAQRAQYGYYFDHLWPLYTDLKTKDLHAYVPQA